MKRISIVLLGVAILLGGCAANTPVVVSDRDESVVMPASGTYAWGESEDLIAGEGQTRVKPETHEMIRQAVDRVMQSRGYRLVPASEAGFLVHFHVGLVAGKVAQDVTTPSKGPVVSCNLRECRDSFAWGYYGAPEVTTRMVSYREGTLVVDIEERLSKRLAYRGEATQDLGGRPRLDAAALDKALSEMMASLPAVRR